MTTTLLMILLWLKPAISRRLPQSYPQCQMSCTSYRMKILLMREDFPASTHIALLLSLIRSWLLKSLVANHPVYLRRLWFIPDLIHLLHATFAARASCKPVAWNCMVGSILESGRTAAASVEKLSHFPRTSVTMSAFTRESDRTFVRSARKASHNLHIWRPTRGSTPGNARMFVGFAIKVSSFLLCYANTSLSTKNERIFGWTFEILCKHRPSFDDNTEYLKGYLVIPSYNFSVFCLLSEGIWRIVIFLFNLFHSFPLFFVNLLNTVLWSNKKEPHQTDFSIHETCTWSYLCELTVHS